MLGNCLNEPLHNIIWVIIASIHSSFRWQWMMCISCVYVNTQHATQKIGEGVRPWLLSIAVTWGGLGLDKSWSRREGGANSKKNDYVICERHLIKGGGFRPITFEKNRARSWRGRPGHVPTFWGKFWVHTCNTAHVRPRSKNWGKNQNMN